jgi:hypothetical protein
MYTCSISQTFRRNAPLVYFYLAAPLLHLFFNLKDGVSTFLRDVDKALPDYTASEPNKNHYS